MNELSLCAVVAACGAPPDATGAPDATDATDARPPVLAFYYGWYGTPDGSGAWRHWNDAGHDPDRADASGRRDIAAAHYPAAEVYDSLDDATIDRHLAEAETAALSGFVVSWWGAGSFEDRALEALCDRIDAGGSALRLAVYYEFVPDYDPARAAVEIGYLRAQYFQRRCYLRQDDRPLLLVYGRAIFPWVFCLVEACPEDTPNVVDWATILAAAREEGPVAAIGDVLSHAVFPDHVTTLHAMSFDGAHFYNPHVEVGLGLDMDAIYADFTRAARKAGLLAAATVIPGYDDTALDRPLTSQAPREGTDLYRRLWAGARAAEPDLYLVTSFNEWHEGTEIEPSREDDAFLRLTREFGPPR